LTKISKQHSYTRFAEQAISSANTDRAYTRSSSFKLALFFALLLSISVFVLTYFLYQFNEDSFIREIESVVNSNISTFEGWNIPEFDPADRVTLLETMQTSPAGLFYVYYDQYDTVLYADIEVPKQEVTTLFEGLIQFEVTPEDILRGPPLPDGATAIAAGKIKAFEDGSNLLIAQDVGEALRTRQQMRFFGTITIGLMVTVIVISFLISNYVVALTNRIAQTSREIVSTGDLSRRIDVDTNWDDLSNLAGILNHMLDRIENLMDGVRRVSDNIAHDLRTPLSRLRSNLEILESKAEKDNDQELLDTTQLLTSEADHLLQTFSALLRIANIESGKFVSEFAENSVATLLEDVIELYDALAEEKGIALHSELDKAVLNCDRDLLFQAFANVLDNAIKFSPSGSSINIQLSASKEKLSISIVDQGSWVPEEDKDKIFTRFYRAEQSRNSAGNGLGLTLVAVIIDLHAGQIELNDNNPGLEVKILIPIRD
jgi:signal transduction histidine kinase